MEGHRFELQNRLAGVVHWTNIALEALRREEDTQFSGVIDVHLTSAAWVNPCSLLSVFISPFFSRVSARENREISGSPGDDCH